MLALLENHQTNAKKPALSVIRAVLTRWTCHLRAYERLLLLRPHLLGIVIDDEARDDKDKLIITGDAKSKRKSEEMCDLIKNDRFWKALTR